MDAEYGSGEAVYSDPEDGDSELQSQFDKADKQLIMEHKGNLPKEKR